MEVSIKLVLFVPAEDGSDLTHITWPRWLARFEHFLAGKQIKTEDNEARLGYLFLFRGPVVEETWETNKFRRAESKKAVTYSEVTTILKEVFDETKNTCRDIMSFRELRQSKDETFATFLRRLRVAATNITFEPVTPQTLTEQQTILQAVIGCGNAKIKESFLKENKLTTDRMIAIAAVVERMQRERNTQLSTASAPVTVDAVAWSRKNTSAETFRPRASSFSNRSSYAQQQTGVKKATGELSKQCFGCGRAWHEGGRSTCPAREEDCRNCGKKGHFARICMKGKQPPTTAVAMVQAEPEAGELMAVSSEPRYNIFQIAGRSEMRPVTTITINNQPAEVIVDSGAEVSVCNRETYDRMGAPKLFAADRKLTAFGAEDSLPVLGYIKATLAKKGERIIRNIYVVNLAVKNLLGYQDAVALKILVVQLAAVSEEKNHPRITHPELFKGLDRFKGEEVHLQVNPEIAPSMILNRRIPFHLRPLVEAEVERLKQLDIIEEVHGPSKWVSPLILVPRKNGKIRMCTDARGPNTAILQKIVIMPTMEDLIVSFNGCRVFSKIDLNEGYHQLVLDEQSRELTPFATHHGLFRYKRLNFGINAAAELFQEAIERILPRTQGIRNTIDDILIGGKTQAEHDERLLKVLDALRNYGLTVNDEKCVFGVKEVTFYGHIFSDDGVGLDPGRVIKISNMGKPADQKELQSWLGMVNYCARFLPNLAQLLEPLRRNSNKGEFVWTKEMDKGWTEVLDQLSKHKKLGYFDEKLPTAVVTDAGPVAIAGMLVQFEVDGTPTVRGYYSKLLTPTEQRYSQLDREMLGISASLLHFQLYLLGRPFKVFTDRHPLISMLSKPNASLPTRVQRMQLKIQEFDFRIYYIKGTENPADYLSRHPVAETVEDSLMEVESFVNAVAEAAMPVAWNKELLTTETSKDEVLQSIITIINNVHFPEQTIRKRADLHQFLSIWKELTVTSEGLLLKQNKLVVPKALQQRAIELAHQGHQGIRRTKELLRGKVWFAGIDKSVETFVSQCEECAITTKQVNRTPVTITEVPPGPWKWLTMDFAEVAPNFYYFVVEDMYSKYSSFNKKF